MSANQPVRHPVPPATNERRSDAEDMALRSPAVTAELARSVFKLPPHDPLRRQLMPEQTAAMLSAINRRDWELFVGPPYGPIAEVRIRRESQTPVGLKASYQGPEPLREMFGDWEGSWGDFRVEPLELVDFGDRWVIVMRYEARGASSGIEVTDTAACLVTAPGEGYRLDFFWQPEAAIAAARGA